MDNTQKQNIDSEAEKARQQKIADDAAAAKAKVAVAEAEKKA